MDNKGNDMVIILLLALAGAILYRCGGASWGNTKIRDCGVPAIALLTLFYLKIQTPWWVHFLSFGFMFASLTSYFDSLFGYDNFWFAGFVIGISYILYPLFGSVSWIGFGIRTILLAVIMGGLNKLVHKYNIPYRDWIEELSRGFAIIITLPILSL